MKQHELELAVQRVRELHESVLDDLFCRGCSIEHPDGSRTYVKYPCPTIKALDGK